MGGGATGTGGLPGDGGRRRRLPARGHGRGPCSPVGRGLVGPLADVVDVDVVVDPADDDDGPDIDLTTIENEIDARQTHAAPRRRERGVVVVVVVLVVRE